MSHSVARHLSVPAHAYDVEIRRFVPAYDAMIDAPASAEVLFCAGPVRVLASTRGRPSSPPGSRPDHEAD